jgi:hypothetical protein
VSPVFAVFGSGGKTALHAFLRRGFALRSAAFDHAIFTFDTLETFSGTANVGARRRSGHALSLIGTLLSTEQVWMGALVAVAAAKRI